MKKGLIIFFCFLSFHSHAQSHAEDVARTAMHIWKDSFTIGNDKYAKWRYDQGVILKGIEGIWNATGDPQWYNYIQKSLDFYVNNDGTIRHYRPDEYNIDHINNGKLVLMLYRVTGKEKYRKAADLLRNQLKTHPRTSEGGFWHKKIYPGQMWLDGLYMAQPFYAEYAKIFGEDSIFNDIARQFILMEHHARDKNTGLLYHGWDETRKQQWADKKTGLSPHIWGRALGWFGMAMVDVLDHFPMNHPGRDSIIHILSRFVKAVTEVQDKKSGLWYDIPNLAHREGNYVEASASSMLTYTIAKSVRLGYVDGSYIENAKSAYKGILDSFIKKENGFVNLHGTVAVSGLGGKPYRDGSFEYYMSEPVVINDPKGMGAFINAAVEMEMLPLLHYGKCKKVLLDNWFNSETKKDHEGKPVSFHYTWEDRANSGFYMLGQIFQRHGACIDELQTAPDASKLENASVYIIVDPDTEKETEKPNFINEKHAKTIAKWVRDGGTLLLLANDAGNADLKNTNILSAKFGIRFNEDNFNLVKNNVFEQGRVNVPQGSEVFPSSTKVFIKELATLSISGSAQPVLSKDGKIIAAIAEWGKGKVFVMGDPWLYNEYIDGRKLPLEYENYKAATELVKWLLNTD